MTLNLFRKRDLARYKADFTKHFLCTFRREPYGLWLNLQELRDISPEERAEVIIEIFHEVGLNE